MHAVPYNVFKLTSAENCHFPCKTPHYALGVRLKSKNWVRPFQFRHKIVLNVSKEVWNLCEHDNLLSSTLIIDTVDLKTNPTKIYENAIQTVVVNADLTKTSCLLTKFNMFLPRDRPLSLYSSEIHYF